MTTPITADTLATELAHIDTALAAAEAEVTAGGSIDLTGLDDRIGHLCGHLAELATGDRRRMLGPLEGLISRCDALGQVLAQARDQTRRTDGPSMEQAARAYSDQSRDSGGQ